LTAVINQPSGEYTVVIYNDTDIPMTFRLWVENGAFPMEEGEMEQSAAQPESSPSLAQTQPQTAALSRDASADPVYTVQAGDTLSLIAQSVYSDLALYDRLCRYNSIINCNLIAVGQTIRTPALAALAGGPVSATVPSPLPATVARESSVVQTAATSTTGEAVVDPTGSYTVATGDILGTIAQKLYGDFQRFREICTLNNLADCNSVSVGQVLRLPGGSSAPQPIAQVQTSSGDGAPQTSDMSLVPTLEQSADMGVFIMLWKATGLLSFLETDGPLTLFVPSDTVFAPTVQTDLNMWMNNKQVLEQLLSYHILVQSFDPDRTIAEPVNLRTLEGSTIRLERTADGRLLVNGANVIGTPVITSNGTIYTIDQILSPPE